MRASICSFVLAFFLGAAGFAQSDAVRNLVAAGAQPDLKAVETAVTNAIRSDDPALRTIAARIATVRRLTGLVNLISSYADREPNAEAAREEARAMILLGGKRNIDHAFYISDRFSKRLDGPVATAAAYLGADAVDSYFASMQKRKIDAGDFFRAALWNRPQLAANFAARLLANDKEAFKTFMFVTESEPRLLIDTDTLIAALTSTDLELRADTVWFLITHALKPSAASSIDSRLRDAIGALRVPRDNADLIVSVELLRRAIGLPQRNFVEFRYSLANEDVQDRLYFAPSKVFKLMNDIEKSTALEQFGKVEEDSNQDIPPFVLPSTLPQGMTAAIMSLTGCKEGWLGTAKVKVDENGLVVWHDLSAVDTSDNCKRALDMMLRYSIVENFLITAPRQSDNVSLVHAPNGPLCFDETRVISMPTERVFGWPAIRVPRATRKVNPSYPAGVARTAVDVGVETMVTAGGCVRAVRLVKPTASPALNAAALFAAQQWQFEPALINTNAVDWLQDITIEFRP
ncbi:MAG TPA: energy transducer TonB [Thermoanaerobaculia bacterium]|nr:energy transducer TonB [Thermoanaerobaculia bacterium]